MGENIANDTSDKVLILKIKVLILKIHKELIQFNTKKTKKPQANKQSD